MAESIFLQFDKDFERLENTDKENISYWKEVQDKVYQIRKKKIEHVPDFKEQYFII